MLDPIFDLLAGLLAWFYSLVPSYGFAIIALTTLVLAALSPLTYKSTKSMVSMRRLQPQVKRLQKKHAGDREKLNQEMMALYQEHGVSPLSGCLPILIQSPVFIVMFRVIRGITSRASDIGFAAGGTIARQEGAIVQARELGGSVSFETFNEDVVRTFNPQYLDEGSDMYQSLLGDTEMLWLGLDLSRTPLQAIRDGIGEGIPYLLAVAIVAALGWYQQHQIQGRMTSEISSQQQLIMKIMPWMLPIFAFTMPGGLVLYFIVSSLLRVLQQAYITRNVYGNEELTTPIELDDDDEFDDDDDDDGTPENPLAGLFGGGAKTETAPSAKHGTRRPTSGNGSSKKRARPPRDSGNGSGSTKKPGSSAKPGSSTKNKSNGAAAPAEKATGWGRAKRSAPTKNDSPEKPVSRRVTPKGDSAPNRRRKK